MSELFPQFVRKPKPMLEDEPKPRRPRGKTMNRELARFSHPNGVVNVSISHLGVVKFKIVGSRKAKPVLISIVDLYDKAIGQEVMPLARGD